TSQQLSVMAARSISGRLLAQIGEPQPETVLALTDEHFRSFGYSKPKMSYIRDLATKVASSELNLRTIGRLKDEEIIAQLIAVKGIGRWTAQMFLIFSLGRRDVLPH